MRKIKKSWIIELEVKRRVEVITEPCTEAEARKSPYGVSIQETTQETEDWKILSIKENK